MNPGDRVKIANVGCYGDCTGKFVRYTDDGYCIVDLLHIGELEFSLAMVDAGEK